MKFLIVWILMSAVTYWFTKYSWFGKDVFQHNLKVEGSERDVIAFFCVMLAVAWPLWWLLMFPVCICIGRKEPPRTNPAQNDAQRRCDSPNAEVLPGNAAAMREALESTEELLEHFAKPGSILADAFALHMRDNRAALAAPPRNCDVGTPKEQTRRNEAFCDYNLRKTGCKGCPANAPKSSCKFAWAQMPYEAVQEGDSNGSK